jgi:hypothetical protein
MNISLRKSLAGAALVASVTLLGAGVASAEQVGPVSVTVPPGGRSCVTTTQRAGYRVRTDGSAPAAKGNLVQWTEHQSYDGVNFYTVNSQTGTGNYHAGDLNSNFYPQLFPSYWRLCARNLGTTLDGNVKATLTVKTDGNAF